MRVGITITGLVLLAAGAATLSLGLGAFGAERAGAPLLDAAMTRHGGADWFWPVVAAVAEIVTLAGAVWTARLLRNAAGRRRAAVDGPTRMLARAAGRDLVRAAKPLPGVRDVRTRLTGSTDRPRLLLDVDCDGATPLGEIHAALGTGPADRYRAAMGMPELIVVIRFRLPEPEPAPAVVPEPEPAHA
ncbi:hypothetical protein [Spirillospora sp. NPDC047279]|uniref:hypothetical protein n=1 Tax=Spirillospora sp. NPDC047279 TaxID=3155478 RepID=UPI0033C9AC63